MIFSKTYRYRAIAAMVFKNFFRISLLRLYWTENIGTNPSDSFSFRVFHLSTLKFYQIHAIFQCPRKRMLPLPRRCRDDFFQNLPLPRQSFPKPTATAPPWTFLI
jgi:hypothetical protein